MELGAAWSVILQSCRAADVPAPHAAAAQCLACLAAAVLAAATSCIVLCLFYRTPFGCAAGPHLPRWRLEVHQRHFVLRGGCCRRRNWLSWLPMVFAGPSCGTLKQMAGGKQCHAAGHEESSRPAGQQGRGGSEPPWPGCAAQPSPSAATHSHAGRARDQVPPRLCVQGLCAVREAQPLPG